MLGHTTLNFYIAKKFLPEDIENFNINISEESVNFIKNGDLYDAHFSDGRYGRFSITNDTVVFSTDEGYVPLAMNEVLDIENITENTIPFKVEDFGTPIKVIREKNKILLEQQEGMLTELNVSIEWDE